MYRDEHTYAVPDLPVDDLRQRLPDQPFCSTPMPPRRFNGFLQQLAVMTGVPEPLEARATASRAAPEGKAAVASAP